MSGGPRGTPLDLHAIAGYLAERRASPIAELGLLDEYCDALLAHCRALRAALADALVAINNLALCHPAEAHKSVLLRKHPYCSELDFCLLHDARDREERAAAVLAQATDA